MCILSNKIISISISILVIVFFLSQEASWGPFWPQVRSYMAFINESDFLLGCYGNDQLVFDFVLWLVSLTCVNQSVQSSRNRFPPYRPVQNEYRTKNEYYLLDNNSASPGFEPRSAAWEADGIPMYHLAPIVRSCNSQFCYRSIHVLFKYACCVKWQYKHMWTLLVCYTLIWMDIFTIIGHIPGFE